MIKFAAITPHPPIIIPGIGSPSELNMVKKTIKSMETLAEEIALKDVDTVTIISPHGTIYPDRINISYGGEFQGDFSQFGKEDIMFDFDSDDKLAEHIIYECEEAGIDVNRYTENEILDHGITVPMYYLRKGLPEDVKILPINYSMQSNESQYKFGEIISNLSYDKFFREKNIAIIASGDMSHRLFDHNATVGKNFDKKIAKDIQNNAVQEILEYDPDWIDLAGECGYRSIAMLLGALKRYEYNAKVLSYEGPFGVGYLVVNMGIKN